MLSNMQASPPRYQQNNCSLADNLRAIVLYEDFLTGCRAHTFAECLATNIGVGCDLSEALWNLDLLKNPIIATELVDNVSCCDYLIISLRGDNYLSEEARRWVASLKAVSTTLILLLDSKYCNMQAAASAWSYLIKLTGNSIASCLSVDNLKWQPWAPEMKWIIGSNGQEQRVSSASGGSFLDDLVATLTSGELKKGRSHAQFYDSFERCFRILGEPQALEQRPSESRQT